MKTGKRKTAKPGWKQCMYSNYFFCKCFMRRETHLGNPRGLMVYYSAHHILIMSTVRYPARELGRVSLTWLGTAHGVTNPQWILFLWLCHVKNYDFTNSYIYSRLNLCKKKRRVLVKKKHLHTTVLIRNCLDVMNMTNFWRRGITKSFQILVLHCEHDSVL